MAHIHEKIDFCSEVYIVHNNKVLLRMHDKYHVWLSVGGHIELDEDPTQAAVREVKEEVGLEVLLHGSVNHFSQPGHKELIPPAYLLRHRVNEKHEHVVFVYFGTVTTDILNIPTHEMAQCKWFTAEELSDMKYGVLPNVAFYAREALKVLGKK